MKKDIIVIFTSVVLLIVLIMGTNFQTVDEYYLTHIDDITDNSQTVTLTIQCKDVLKNYDKLDASLKNEKYVPSDGIILPTTKYVLRNNDTVFDILYRAVRYERIQFDFQGAEDNTFNTIYIKSINYLYEFSCGENSGWLYKVNNKSPNCGCSDYRLSDGDSIEVYYSCSPIY